jgi:hypothetical protein
MQDHFSTAGGGIDPRPGNTGVNYSPSPKITLDAPQKITPFVLDWLRLSFSEKFVDLISDCLIRDGFHPVPTKGKHGYFRGYSFRDDPLSTVDSGLFIWWGGDALKGRATVDCSGQFAERLFSLIYCLPVDFSVRRLDLCLDFDGLDFLSGQDAIVHALENWPYPGIKPKFQKIDDMGQGTGSTFYVGDRNGQCYVRWYQKGLQMRDLLRPDWCRFEIEIKPKTSQQGVIAWDWLKNGRRDDLARSGFSAAFLPYFTGSDATDKRIIPPEQKVRDFFGRIDVMVTQYGGLIGEMLHRSDGDWSVVASMISDAMRRKREAKQVVNLSSISDGDIPY